MVAETEEIQRHQLFIYSKEYKGRHEENPYYGGHLYVRQNLDLNKLILHIWSSGTIFFNLIDDGTFITDDKAWADVTALFEERGFEGYKGKFWKLTDYCHGKKLDENPLMGEIVGSICFLESYANETSKLCYTPFDNYYSDIKEGLHKLLDKIVNSSVEMSEDWNRTVEDHNNSGSYVDILHHLLNKKGYEWSPRVSGAKRELELVDSFGWKPVELK